MTLALIITASVVGYLACSVVGWRYGYVRGYEGSRRDYAILGHRSHAESGRWVGALWAVFGPFGALAFLIAKFYGHFTPTPPSVQRDRLEDELRERENRIRDLEREAGLR